MHRDVTTSIITALVCSARRRGNAYELADYCLSRLREGTYRRTRLLNFFEYDVQACQHCDYECLRDQLACPLGKDDVAWLWEYTRRSDAVLWAVPVYAGAPPALWLAFIQRTEYLRRLAPPRRIPLAVICVASRGSGDGDAAAELLRRQAAEPWWELADFARFDAGVRALGSVADGLIAAPEVRQRLDRTAAALLSAIDSPR